MLDISGVISTIVAPPVGIDGTIPLTVQMGERVGLGTHTSSANKH